MGRRRKCSYDNSKKQKYRKGSWTKEEDQKLIDHIQIHGKGSWSSLPKAAGLKRCGKSCRLRWMNYLRPDIKHGNFSLDEEDLIVKLHTLLGNRWSLIAGRLPGRTDNEVKNYWNSNIKRKLIHAGIDPNNHRIHQYIQFKIHNNINVKDKEKSSLSTIQKSHDDADDGGDEAVSSTLKLHRQTTVVVRPRPRPHPSLVKS